jgi:hypothetical protein
MMSSAGIQNLNSSIAPSLANANSNNNIIQNMAISSRSH